MIYVLFALASSGFWAVSNLVDKNLVEKHIKNPIMLTLLSAILFFSLSLLLIPFANFSDFNIMTAIAAAFAGIIVLPAIIPYYKALAIEEASRVIPLWQFTPVFTLILAMLFLGEAQILTVTKYIGFFLLLIGGFLITTKELRNIFRPGQVFYLMLLSSFLFAVSAITLKYSFSGQNFFNVLILMQTGQITAVILYLMPKSNRKQFLKAYKQLTKKGLSLVTASAVFGFSGRIMFNLAVMSGLVSLVIVLGGFQGFFVFILAAFLSIFFPRIINEQIDKKTLLIKTFAISMMIIGLYLLYL